MLSLTVASCSFRLAGKIYAPPGKSGEQQRIDVVACRDRATSDANKISVSEEIGAIVLGWSVVGAPIVFAESRSKQRELFAQCMKARGYTVLPPDDDSPKQANVPAGTGSSARDDVISKMEKLKSLRDKRLITEKEYNGKKKEILDRM